MNEELFSAEAVTQESPRMRWIREKAVHTYFTEDTQSEKLPWCAWHGTTDPFVFLNANGEGAFGYGEAEDDALADWARKWGERLWNEEEGL